ncbi:MAG: endonuclease/exonuclease/phosphatase family protein [Coleofasciculus sp. G3-WIS-01]|uniref:endonuclease/exonuclease/phosphatase family protein n=1 Tax=Coleofasciculus sp. G3-WIS-01 TaxID=3069528 RepID=UPI00330149BC
MRNILQQLPGYGEDTVPLQQLDMKSFSFSQQTFQQIEIKNIAFGLGLTGLIPCLLLSLAAYLGGFHRYFELISHFKVQYFVISCIVFILFSLAKRKTWWLVSLFCLTLNAVEVIPWYIPQFSPIHTSSGQPLRVLLANVYSDNQRYAEFISLVKAEKPQLLVVQEVNPIWSQQLEALKPLLPYQTVYPRFDNFGIAVYSAIPLMNTDIKLFTEYDIPSIFAEVQWQGSTVSIIATHPLPPINAEYFKSRNQQLLELGKVISSINNIHAVIGDLNTTMWSLYYRQFIRQTELKNARVGFGILPTWPQGAPMLQIPLDHCLISPKINVLAIRTAGDIGSDHRPLIVDLVIPEQG